MLRRLDVPFAMASGEGSLLGESPFWDRRDSVWWVDIEGRKLLRTRLSTGETRHWTTPEMPGFVVLAAPDEPMVGMERGIYAFSCARERFERILPFDGLGQRFNDATVDATGRLWVSTMALDAAPGRGAIHVVTAELALNTVFDGLTTPNGLAVDVTAARLYLSDSHPDARTIWTAACDGAAGLVGPRTVFASMRDMAGRPDGAALGADGATYWIAAVDGGALCGFSRQGVLHSTVPLPFIAPTKLAFVDGGLVVTAKAQGGHGGQMAIATGLPPDLRGPAVAFWQAGRR
ncbi:SMP-30/gluconolactonase/LRE family protein [Aquibium carbonis]|uniref:SMP-30/gluconolactonase/LRE family protein n=1 Tax=Aquibium carbonis TaxID=2495581 RepID=UPI001478745A|nr:SMP-30/gluconolactonase/LRE family protein [Aquibium carbonis]